MTSATATAPYPFVPTTSAMAASMRSRCDSRTTSRGAAWRPRGRAGVLMCAESVRLREQACFYDRTAPENAGMPATAEPHTAPTAPAGSEPRHVRVGIVGAGFAGLG